MGVVLEHIASALGATRQQLNEKFKELWASDSAVLKLLKSNVVMKVGQGKTIDLDWFEARNKRRSEEHTSELQSLMRISYAVFCLKKKKQHNTIDKTQSQ